MSRRIIQHTITNYELLNGWPSVQLLKDMPVAGYGTAIQTFARHISSLVDDMDAAVRAIKDNHLVRTNAGAPVPFLPNHVIEAAEWRGPYDDNTIYNTGDCVFDDKLSIHQATTKTRATAPGDNTCWSFLGTPILDNHRIESVPLLQRALEAHGKELVAVNVLHIPEDVLDATNGMTAAHIWHLILETEPTPPPENADGEQ